MTRDEAIAAFKAAGGASFSDAAWIDRLVAVGVLKLDAPADPVTTLAVALGWPIGSRSEAELRQALADSGLTLTRATKP